MIDNVIIERASEWTSEEGDGISSDRVNSSILPRVNDKNMPSL